MDNRAEIREFLTTRRAKIKLDQAGLLAGGGTRRVRGLRREEVAVLAGASTDWYVRLEKGHIAGVSEDVLDAVARPGGTAPPRPACSCASQRAPHPGVDRRHVGVRP